MKHTSNGQSVRLSEEAIAELEAIASRVLNSKREETFNTEPPNLSGKSLQKTSLPDAATINSMDGWNVTKLSEDKWDVKVSSDTCNIEAVLNNEALANILESYRMQDTDQTDSSPQKDFELALFGLQESQTHKYNRYLDTYKEFIAKLNQHLEMCLEAIQELDHEIVDIKAVLYHGTVNIKGQNIPCRDLKVEGKFLPTIIIKPNRKVFGQASVLVDDVERGYIYNREDEQGICKFALNSISGQLNLESKKDFYFILKRLLGLPR